MATPTYTVRWTETAVKRLKTIPDRRIQRAIHTRAGQLDHDREQQGIALLGEFMGFRRVEAVGKRYRIIYRVERVEVAVVIVHSYNQRGTAEQWIKEGKEATHWTRLSCHRFRANEVRLPLGVIAYNLGNLLRRLTLPRAIQSWSLTSLQQRLIIVQFAEGHLTGRLFRQILDRIERLRWHPI